MIVKLLTEHYLEFLSLKGGCRGSSESTIHLSKCHIVGNDSYNIYIMTLKNKPKQLTLPYNIFESKPIYPVSSFRVRIYILSIFRVRQTYISTSN